MSDGFHLVLMLSMLWLFHSKTLVGLLWTPWCCCLWGHFLHVVVILLVGKPLLILFFVPFMDLLMWLCFGVMALLIHVMSFVLHAGLFLLYPWAIGLFAWYMSLFFMVLHGSIAIRFFNISTITWSQFLWHKDMGVSIYFVGSSSLLGCWCRKFLLLFYLSCCKLLDLWSHEYYDSYYDPVVTLFHDFEGIFVLTSFIFLF